MIPVTRPYLPNKSTYDTYLTGVWERNWLTNNGPLLNEFELKLKSYLHLKHLLVVNNGTIALQIAIKCLDLKGEIITTPFSYVATSSSIVWEGCKPVFVDIDENTLNINSALIEAAITENTSAILATHCFGNACNIDAIQDIASRNNIKVIYDAAHCFGSTYNEKSIFEYGDISTLSLHATKILHSVEGGAVISKDPEIIKKVSRLRNFGHDGPEKFSGVGINAKNSEVHSAMGLAVLTDIDQILERRKSQCEYYDELLQGLKVKKQHVQEGCTINYSYYPIIFKDEIQLLKSKKALEAQRIFPRRYFYPSLDRLHYVHSEKMEVANSIASRILCLPLFHTLRKEEQKLIARILLRTQNYG